MIASTTTGGRWPSRLAYAAALTFTLASGGTNLVYGWTKGTDLASSLVWAAVSLGASIVFALSWPGFIASLDRRQWSRAAMVFVALLLTGAYSISAAVGSAMGGRTNAATEEEATTDARTKAKAGYEAAQAELSKLAPSRLAGELTAALARAKANPRSAGCVAVGGSTAVVCPKLEAELARAHQRERLQATLERTAGELAKIGVPKAANTDAAALAAYLTALGWPITADTLNKLLVLLAVLVIECGGGLSLAVGMALSGATEQEADRRTSGRTQVDRTAGHTRPDTCPDASISEAQPCPGAVETPLQHGPDAADKTAAGVRFLAFLAERGGVLVSGQRQIGRALGWSKSWAHEVLHDLACAGLVKLTTGKTGTVVRLVAVKPRDFAVR